MSEAGRDVAVELLERLQVVVQDGPGTVYPACRVCDANLFMDGHTDDCPVPEIEDALLREPSEAREPDAWIPESVADVLRTGLGSDPRTLPIYRHHPCANEPPCIPVYFGGASPKEPEGDEWQGLDARVDYCRWQDGLDRYCLRPAGHDDDHRFGPRPDGWPKHRATPPEEASEGEAYHRRAGRESIARLTDYLSRECKEPEAFAGAGRLATDVALDIIKRHEGAAQSQETEYTEKLDEARRYIKRYAPAGGGLYNYWRGVEIGLIEGWRLASHGTEGKAEPLEWWRRLDALLERAIQLASVDGDPELIRVVQSARSVASVAPIPRFKKP